MLNLETGLQNKKIHNYLGTEYLIQRKEHEARNTYCGASLKDSSGDSSWAGSKLRAVNQKFIISCP